MIRLPSWAAPTALSLALVACGSNDPANKVSDQAIYSESAIQAFLDAPENTLTRLIDFSNADQRDWISTRDAQVEFDAKSGDLNIRFSPKVNTSQVRIAPPEGWDLSAYPNYNLAFEVENLSDVSTHFYLNNEDAEGKYQSRSLSIPAGFKGTVYIPLRGAHAETNAGTWGDLEPWQTEERMMVWRSWRGPYDLNSLSALTFASIGILEERELLISNIRLRANPPEDPMWLTDIVDKFGQYASVDYPNKIHSDQELKEATEKELAELAKSEGVKDRSRFGGYKDGPKLDATGYFRTQKVDGKWWMVDPDGYLFFSHGPANVRMANMTTLTGVDFKDPSVRVINADETTPEDSMGIIKVSDEVRDTRYVTNVMRNDMFQWLPSYDDELAEHYSYRRSTHKGPIAHGETFSFYRANLERRYGETEPESYIRKWEEVTMDRMKDWGFTSFGNWVDPAFYEHAKVPYFANGWIIGDFQKLSGYKNHWGLMPDAYDPLFAERAKITIELIAENVKSSPWCVGIFIDNEKSWGEREGTVPQRYGVILDALSKDSSSPAKVAFTKHLKAKYGDIAKLNSAWDSKVSSWTAFEAGVEFDQYSDALVADLSRMLEMLGEQYFTVVHDTLEKTLPNHLYMGARMANWGMPDEIIKASLTYSDVLSFNIYEEGMQDEHWDFLEEVDLPVVIGEFHIGAETGTGFFQPGIVHAADQHDRARMYKLYMESVLSKPFMVGAHWFQYMDEPVTGRAFDGENANIGFVTVTDVPYPELIKAVKEITTDLYPKRYGK